MIICYIYHKGKDAGFMFSIFKISKFWEILNIREHGILLHDQVIPGHQQGHQLLIEALYLGQVVILDKLQLGHVQAGDGAPVNLKTGESQSFDSVITMAYMRY